MRSGSARVVGHSISLDGDIAVNFFMELDSSITQSETAYMLFSIPDAGAEYRIQKVYVKDVAPDKFGYYVFKCRVAAKNMTTVITAQIFDEGREGTIYTYSVNEYADYLLEHRTDNEDYAKAAPLVEKMLRYGVYAKAYFDGTQLDNLEDVEINAPETAFDLPAGVTFEGATLSLKSQTSLSLYFSSDTTLSFDVNNKTVETAKNGAHQVVRICGIAASELQDSFTLTVTAGEDSGTVTYSPMNYCKNVLTPSVATPDEAQTQTQDAKLVNVVKALYQYSQAAMDYFNPNPEGI